jgi:hypothetical protein
VPSSRSSLYLRTLRCEARGVGLCVPLQPNRHCLPLPLVQVKDAQRIVEGAREDAARLRTDSAAVELARERAVAEANACRTQLDALSLAAQRFRALAEASTARLALAEDAIATLQAMLVEQDGTIAAQSAELQAMHVASRDGMFPQRAPVLAALSGIARVRPADDGNLDSRAQYERTPTLSGRSSGAAPSLEHVASSSSATVRRGVLPISKVDWLGRHLERMEQQEQRQQKEPISKREDPAAHALAQNSSDPQHAGALQPHRIDATQPSTRSPRPVELDPDFRSRVQAREELLRASFESHVAIAVEASKLEVIARLQGQRGAEHGADKSVVLSQLFPLFQGVQRDSSLLAMNTAGSSVLNQTVDAALTAAAEQHRIRGASFDAGSVTQLSSSSDAPATLPLIHGTDGTHRSSHTSESIRNPRSIEGGGAQWAHTNEAADDDEAWTYVLPQQFARI